MKTIKMNEKTKLEYFVDTEDPRFTLKRKVWYSAELNDSGYIYLYPTKKEALSVEADYKPKNEASSLTITKYISKKPLDAFELDKLVAEDSADIEIAIIKELCNDMEMY